MCEIICLCLVFNPYNSLLGRQFRAYIYQIKVVDHRNTCKTHTLLALQWYQRLRTLQFVSHMLFYQRTLTSTRIITLPIQKLCLIDPIVLFYLLQIIGCIQQWRISKFLLKEWKVTVKKILMERNLKNSKLRKIEPFQNHKCNYNKNINHV